jgi:purine-binding chemotaxis protein CheW
MTNLYLIVRIGGSRAALPAAEVGSVVEVEEITPVPKVAPHVAGLFALRSRVLTVIDTSVSLGLPPADTSAMRPAVIATVSGHSYALLVDEVDDVIEGGAAEPCPAVLHGGWARAQTGVIRHEERLVPLLDPALLATGATEQAAA